MKSNFQFLALEGVKIAPQCMYPFGAHGAHAFSTRQAPLLKRKNIYLESNMNYEMRIFHANQISMFLIHIRIKGKIATV